MPTDPSPSSTLIVISIPVSLNNQSPSLPSVPLHTHTHIRIHRLTHTPLPSHHQTGRPKVFGGSPSEVASINHGTYFWHAAQEGLLARDNSSVHAGIRTTLSGLSDYEEDGYCGFEIIEAREIDYPSLPPSISSSSSSSSGGRGAGIDGGIDGIIRRIVERVGTERPVYLSLDIDTLDPAFAPATGTPETGGWSTRELRTILRGLENVNLVGADVVEVAVSRAVPFRLVIYMCALMLALIGPFFVSSIEVYSFIRKEKRGAEVYSLGKRFQEMLVSR